MIKKNTIKLLMLSLAVVSMMSLNSCNKDEGSITPVTIGFSSSSVTVAENAGDQTVTIAFDADAPIDATFDLAISGTAEYGVDFTTSPDGAAGTATVDISAGDSEATFTFTPIDNENVDGDKTVIFTITGSADGVELGSVLEYTITIDDEEGPSNVDFAADANEVAEDAGELTVTLNFGATTTAPGTVDVTMTGDASAVTTNPAATADVFTLSSTSGVDNVTFTVTPVNDTEFAADRVVTFTLSNATNGVELGTQITYELTITEDDAVTIASLRSDYEANGETTFTSGMIEVVVVSEKSNITGRNVVVQDASNGIVLRFNDNNADFDLGDELLVQLSGGTIAENNGVVQIEDLDLTAATELTSGTLPAITPESITVTQFLTGDYQSRLVTIEDVAFMGANGVSTFGSFQSETLVDASGESFNTFIRGGSLLEDEVIPVGAGTVTGIPTEFSGNAELILRSTSDIDMTAIAELAVAASDTDFGPVATTTYSEVKEYALSVASGTLQNDVSVEASANFEISVDGGATFGSTGTIASAAANTSVQVRFFANTGIDGVKEGTITFTSFGTGASIVNVTGEETGNGGATTLLMKEDFDFGTTSGDLTAVASGSWEAHSGAGNGTVSYVADVNISLAGYASTGVGGHVSILNASSEDVSRTFAKQTSGTVYASALVNISAKNTSGDYFFHMREEGGSFQARVYVNDDGAGNLNFGVRSGDTVYGTTSFAYNTDYLVVTKYDIATGVATLYVLSAIEATEPTTPEATATGGSSSDVSQVAFRQGSNTPDATIDAIRVSTDWAGLFEQD